MPKTKVAISNDELIPYLLGVIWGAQDVTSELRSVDWRHEGKIADEVAFRISIDLWCEDDFETYELVCGDTTFLAGATENEFQYYVETVEAPGWQENERVIVSQWDNIFRRSCFLSMLLLSSKCRPLEHTAHEQVGWPKWFNQQMQSGGWNFKIEHIAALNARVGMSSCPSLDT